VVDQVIGKQVHERAKACYLAVIAEVDAVIVVVEQSKGDRLEKSL
jgi:hypothetical protein